MSFNVGDYVKIVDKGATYSNYSDKFRELGFLNVQINNPVSEGSRGIIFAISTHDNSSATLVAINVYSDDTQFGGNTFKAQVLMHERGIKHLSIDQDTILDISKLQPVIITNVSIGDKVVRGHDWMYEDQDGGFGSVGVVIDFDLTPKYNNCWIEVEWKNGSRNFYRAGVNGNLSKELDLCYHPNNTKSNVGSNEKYTNYTVGDKVRKGVHWKYSEQNINNYRGEILKIDKKWALVQWQDGFTEMYRIGHEDKYDIEKIV